MRCACPPLPGVASVSQLLSAAPAGDGLSVCRPPPGLLVFSAIMYAKLLAIPLVVSYHTHIPEYIPRYTWKGLVEPMWNVIRFFTHRADLVLVPSQAMKVRYTTLLVE
jgi:Glycosyltransferase Family 4